VRWRAPLRDALATGFALAIYALVGVTLIIGQGYQVDTVTAQHRATELFLQGENPYRTLDVIASLREFGLDPALGTHLADVHPGSYPELSGAVVPRAGPVPGTRPDRHPPCVPWRESCCWCLSSSGRSGRPGGHSPRRWWSETSSSCGRTSLPGSTPTYALLLALGFLSIRRRTLSPILIGLAAASRQPAWFFIPFYLLAVWRQNGRAEALRRAAILSVAAVVPNLPFFLDAPGAFLAGVSLPMLGALEPYGVGLVRFALDSVLPLWPRAAYGLLSAAVLAGLLALLWRRWRALPNGAVVFPSLVLWFSWRSALNYFGFAAVFALVGDETMRGEADPAPPA